MTNRPSTPPSTPLDALRLELEWTCAACGTDMRVTGHRDVNYGTPDLPAPQHECVRCVPLVTAA